MKTLLPFCTARLAGALLLLSALIGPAAVARNLSVQLGAAGTASAAAA